MKNHKHGTDEIRAMHVSGTLKQDSKIAKQI